MIRAVKFSYTLGLLLKDHSVKFLSTSQNVRELDSPVIDFHSLSVWSVELMFKSPMGQFYHGKSFCSLKSDGGDGARDDDGVHGVPRVAEVRAGMEDESQVKNLRERDKGEL